MAFTAVTLEEMLGDFDQTAAKWKGFFAANPGAAKVPTDIANSGDVGGLMWHLYMASVVHSQRLLGEPVTDFDHAPVKDIAGAWTMQELGSANLRRFLSTTDERALDTSLVLRLRSGADLEIRRGKLCLHVFVHAIRHLAQVGPLVRQHGFSVGWPQDISHSAAIR